MDTRRLRIVKPPLPAIGVCESCNSQFKSNKRSQDEAEIEIRAAFDARIGWACNPVNTQHENPVCGTQTTSRNFMIQLSSKNSGLMLSGLE
jgi:NMD protein affecting ribosome stability and mRNA decay